jgi:rubrerythrin
MPDGIKLDAHHRKTVERLFTHPTSHNIQWHDVLSLLQGVAEVEEAHDGRFRVTLGEETETFDAPRGHDIDTQQIVDLRRMLKGAGYGPA